MKQETVQETIKQEVPQKTVAEDKHTEAGAPLRLMAQFLRAVTENRMENALALAQTSKDAGVVRIPSVDSRDRIRKSAGHLPVGSANSLFR